jgi:hypothetical protein
MLRIMTEITEMPVISFTTKKREEPRPEFEFDLDGRRVTARAPKSAWWTRLWLAQANQDGAELYAEFRAFLAISLGPEVAGWLRARENDLSDSYDLPDMIALVQFLAAQFEPLLKAEFEAAGTSWQSIMISAGAEREDEPETARAGMSAAKPRKAAKKTAARRS